MKYNIGKQDVDKTEIARFELNKNTCFKLSIIKSIPLIALVLFMLAFNIRTVDGNSMQVSLPKDTILISTGNTRNTKIGDIVIVNGNVKRVIGCKGDLVEIKNGEVKVNGRMIELNNGTILSTDEKFNIELLVTNGYFLLGESEDSIDSKHYGQVSSIDERVVALLSNPFTKLKR